MVFRRLPGHYEGFEELKNFIGQGDFRFFNLETTVHNYESYGAAISGGSWFCARPEILQDMKEFGFNVTTTANNHAMDYSHKGLLKTMEYLRAAGLPFSGTGENLGEASAPCYLDTLSGRFALISVCSSFHDDAPAGEQSRTMPGRPGLNPLHFSTTYRLPKEDMETMRRIAGEIGKRADIYKAPHHGTPHTGTPDAIRVYQPALVVVTNGAEYLRQYSDLEPIIVQNAPQARIVLTEDSDVTIVLNDHQFTCRISAD